MYRTRSILVLSLALALGSAMTLNAGTTSIGDDGRTYHVALDAPGATCEIEKPGRSGMWEARCEAGPFYAWATAERGCGDSFGPTYCSMVPPGDDPPTANELRCLSGKAYVLYAPARVEDFDCRIEARGEREMTCASPDSGASASASCARGCGEIRGDVGCCLAGVSGCPPGSAGIDR